MSLAESESNSTDLLSARWRELSRADFLINKKHAPADCPIPIISTLDKQASVLPETEMMDSTTVSNSPPPFGMVPEDIPVEYHSASWSHGGTRSRQTFSPFGITEYWQHPEGVIQDQKMVDPYREDFLGHSMPMYLRNYWIYHIENVNTPEIMNQPHTFLGAQSSQLGHSIQPWGNLGCQAFSPFSATNFSPFLLAKESPFMARLNREAAKCRHLREEAFLYRSRFILDNGCPRYPFHYSSFVALATAVDSIREEETKLQAVTCQPELRKQPAQAPIIRTQSKGFNTKAPRYINMQREHIAQRRCSFKNCTYQSYEPQMRAPLVKCVCKHHKKTISDY